MWTWIAVMLLAPFSFAAGYIVGQRFATERVQDEEFVRREQAYEEGWEDGKVQAKWEASVAAERAKKITAKKSKPKKITAKPKKAT